MSKEFNECKEPLVYIILVNYKSYLDTIECVKSLRNIEYRNYKIIIVENGSKDESYIKLKENLKDELIINLGKNKGFAEGNNIGIRLAMKNNADYVLLLNNDTIVEKDFLKEMVNAFESNDVGIVGCKINYYNNKDIISYAGGEIIWNKFKTRFFRDGDKDIKYEKEKEVTFISGCAMLIKSKVIKDVGLFSNEYFMYYEDTDYCARTLECGFKLIYQPKAKIYHKISSSSGGNLSPFVLYWSTKNRQVFRRKFSYKIKKISLIKFDIFYIFSRIIKISTYLLTNKKDEAKSIFKGYIDGIK